MTTLPYLRNNDIIAITAPAGIVNKKNIEHSINILSTWGLRVKLGENIYNKNYFFAGTDKQRADDLQYFLNDKNFKAIFFARGGYGAIKILEKLDFTQFKKYPKWIIGFSDITVLHSYINKIIHYESIHGVMPNNFADKVSVESLRKLLFGEKNHYTISSHKFNKPGRVKGKLIGGNLSILYSLRGTGYDIWPKGSILFIEDLNESIYHIDRMLMNFKLGGIFKKIKGLIVGHMIDIKDTSPAYGKTVYEVIHDLIAEYNFPVMYNFPAGHGKNNLAMILGREVEVNIHSNESVIRFKS